MRPRACSTLLIGRPRGRRGAGRRPPRAGAVGHRLDGDGPPGRPQLAARFARAILELGGNNAAIVAPSADLDLTPARHRLRRHGHGRPALHHAAPAVRARQRLRHAGRPAREERLWPACRSATRACRHAGRAADRRGRVRRHAAGAGEGRAAGATVHRRRAGGRHRGAETPSTSRPALVEMPAQAGPVLRETFAPILYVLRYTQLDRGHRRRTTPWRRACRRRSSRSTCARPSASCRARGIRLRHRQRQHRPVGRRDRRRLRRREGNRRRPRSRLRQLEGLHAPRHQHHQLRRPRCRWRRA